MYPFLYSNTVLTALTKNVLTAFLSVAFFEFFAGVSHDTWASLEVGAISGMCRIFISLLTLRGAKFSYLEFFAIPLGSIVAGIFHMHLVPGASLFGIDNPSDIANWFLWGQASVWIFGFLVDGMNGFKGTKKE